MAIKYIAAVTTGPCAVPGGWSETAAGNKNLVMFINLLFLLSMLAGQVLSAPATFLKPGRRIRYTRPSSNAVWRTDLTIGSAINQGDIEKLRLALTGQFSPNLLLQFMRTAAMKKQYLAVIELAAASGDNIIALDEAFTKIIADSPTLTSTLISKTNQIFTEAATSGKREVVDILLKHSKGNINEFSEILDELHAIAGKSGHNKMKQDLHYHMVLESKEHTFDKVLKWIRHMNSKEAQEFLLHSMEHQNTDLFGKILKSNPNIDYTTVMKTAVLNPRFERFRIAIFLHLCNHGYTKSLEEVLEAPKLLEMPNIGNEFTEHFLVIDPGIHSRNIDPSFLLIVDGIHLASEGKKLETAKYLMSQIDVSAENNLLINSAAFENNEYLVWTLLKDDRVVKAGLDKALMLTSSDDIHKMLYDRSIIANE